LKKPSERIQRLLVEVSLASLLVQDANGWSPLQAAISKSTLTFELVDFLVERRASYARQVRGVAAPCGTLFPSHVDDQYTKRLVEAHLDSLQAEDSGGRFPLGVATARDAPLDVVHYLIVAWPSSLVILRTQYGSKQ
jgi:ankyrin repeat protein